MSVQRSSSTSLTLERSRIERRAVTRHHPWILTEGGLSAALKALGRRATFRVKLDVTVQNRLPDNVEVAAHHTVSEALTNHQSVRTRHSSQPIVHKIVPRSWSNGITVFRI
jgi:signal transduction histidine kinase